MSLPGFELLYNNIKQQIKSADDAAIAVVHWNLVSNGLKCCGAGESWPDSDRHAENIAGSEALPEGWNSQDNIYALRYVDSSTNRTYLMKALALEGSLILHLVRCFDEKTESTSIRSRDFVNDDHSSVSRAFNNLEELNSVVTKELYTKVVKTGQTESQPSPSASSSNQRQEQPGRSPLMEDPRRGGVGYVPPRQPFGPGFNDPFSVGRADLDPLSGGFGGGMFMDPRGFPRPGFHPGRPNMPGFPPGSIPPGARFDPVGPAGVRPEPDPDHERPPDSYDDMFM